VLGLFLEVVHRGIVSWMRWVVRRVEAEGFS
jgi:hypothetical protein